MTDDFSKGFAIGQPVAQIGYQMALEKRPATIFRRPYGPLAKSPTGSPNVAFNLFNKLFATDEHGSRLSVAFCLSLITQGNGLKWFLTPFAPMIFGGKPGDAGAWSEPQN